jgi:hypothetical protein
MAEQGETARQIAERQNLLEWVEAILNEQIAELDLEAAPHVIDQLTEVVECRAKEIATADLARLRAEGEALRATRRDIIADLVDLCYTDGTSPSWRLCLGCETEYHREDHDFGHGRPDCPVKVAEAWLAAWTKQRSAALATPRTEDGTGR